MSTRCEISHIYVRHISKYNSDYYKDFVQKKQRVHISREMLQINSHTVDKF